MKACIQLPTCQFYVIVLYLRTHVSKRAFFLPLKSVSPIQMFLIILNNTIFPFIEMRNPHLLSISFFHQVSKSSLSAGLYSYSNLLSIINSFLERWYLSNQYLCFNSCTFQTIPWNKIQILQDNVRSPAWSQFCLSLLLHLMLFLPTALTPFTISCFQQIQNLCLYVHFHCTHSPNIFTYVRYPNWFSFQSLSQFIIS